MGTAVDIRPFIPDVSPLKPRSEARAEELHLVRELCQHLAASNITYCHWKSNNVLERSASGQNDLDLLVRPADVPRFVALLRRLGFKRAEAPPEKQMPAVEDYFGYDAAADTFIHVHAHYQLVVGHDLSKNYRLPIEEPYLASAVQGDLFKVPAPAFEFVVFVLRMAIKHLPWDVLLGGEGALDAGERQEFAYLQNRVHQEQVHEILRRHLPHISSDLFESCLRALQPNGSLWQRAKVGQQVQAALQINARRAVLMDLCLKYWRRGTLALRRRIFSPSTRYRLHRANALIAIVGGDGAGKTTAIDALHDWLAKKFVTTRIHLGKPAWSWSTRITRGTLKVGQILGFYPPEASMTETLTQQALLSPGYPWLLREVCRARDRYHNIVRAQRFAAQGGLVVLDRFPLPQIHSMDGAQTQRFVCQLAQRTQAKEPMAPQCASRLTKLLVHWEERYYQQIPPPDILIVLRVDPEIAVQRKTNEDASAVRARSTEIWELNWEDTDAHVVDASRGKAEVLAELKALIWCKL